MLSLINADVFYHKAQALHSVSIDVGEGEIVSLIGRNGAGKTTTLKALVGLLICTTGQLMLDGKDETHSKPHFLSRRGIAFVPETREIFPNLSVLENLLVAQVSHKSKHWTIDRVFELFPILKDRLKSGGDTLSGGEQQMLSIARAILTNPRYLLLDEPTEGLAPKIVQVVKDALVAINQDGVSILIVEQNLKIPLKIAHRQYILENGVVVWEGTTSSLLQDRQTVEKYISL